MEYHPRYLTLRKNTIKKNNWIHILNLPKKKIQTDLSESRESGQIDCEHRLCSTKKHESWTRKFSWSVQCRGRQNGQWNKAGLCPILWLCNKLHNKEEKGEKKAVDLSLTRNVPKKVTNKKWLVNSVRVSLCIQIFLSTGAGGVMAGESHVTVVACLGQPFVYSTVAPLIVITLVQPKSDNNNRLITKSRWTNFSQKTRLVRSSFKDYVYGVWYWVEILLEKEIEAQKILCLVGRCCSDLQLLLISLNN